MKERSREASDNYATKSQICRSTDTMQKLSLEHVVPLGYIDKEREDVNSERKLWPSFL